MIDERQNKISGSGMAGYALCAGKYQLESTMPKQPSGPAAELGNRIHAHIASLHTRQKLAPLPEEELEIANLCIEEHGQVVSALNTGKAILRSVVEERIWFKTLWSGQIDRIDWFSENTALVTDYKSGRIAQSSAAENLQLRAYAVLVKHAYPKLKRIYACIIQPMAGEAATIASYDEKDLEEASRQIASIVERAYQPNAPRTPNPDACKYCRAKTVCPETQQLSSGLVAASTIQVPALTNTLLSEYLEKAEIVEDFIEALKSEAKKRLIAGDEIAGYRLSAGVKTRSVSDADAAYQKIRDIVPAEQFAKACKVSVPKLEEIIGKALDIKGKAAIQEKATALLAETLTVKVGDPKMVKA